MSLTSHSKFYHEHYMFKGGNSSLHAKDTRFPSQHKYDTPVHSCQADSRTTLTESKKGVTVQM